MFTGVVCILNLALSIISESQCRYGTLDVRWVPV